MTNIQRAESADDEDYSDRAQPHIEDPKTLDEFMHLMHSSAIVMLDDKGLPSRDWLKNNFKTKSAAIRFLDLKGFESKVIALHLGIRYQHVRNVLSTELKRGPNEVFYDIQWNCPHTKAPAFVDIIIRKGVKDPSSDRILYRVCCNCARDLIPGCTSDAYEKLLPGVKL